MASRPFVLMQSLKNYPYGFSPFSYHENPSVANTALYKMRFVFPGHDWKVEKYK